MRIKAVMFARSLRMKARGKFAKPQQGGGPLGKMKKGILVSMMVTFPVHDVDVDAEICPGALTNG